MSQIILDTKKVGDIQGHFFIPDYQRGYRWTEKEVILLLEDITANGANPYCLQPIVVRNLGDKYELVDGQQRLTTLYLIYKYIYKRGKGFMPDAKFTLEYETRETSAFFLDNIELSLKNENIDFYFIANAYETISLFFESKQVSQVTQFNQFLDQNVSVIWYEIPENEGAVDLFTRLNIGKIPLTSSELVKALFLRNTQDSIIQNRQEEISLQWDNIERDLHDETFWAFLTNTPGEKYATRIDFILDLMAGKTTEEKDDYYTFFYFDKKHKDGEDLYKIWEGIVHTFLTLKEWRYNHELYHKIGYLVSCGEVSLGHIYQQSKSCTKKELKSYLNYEITRSIQFKISYSELSYEKNPTEIERLLLLFNIESVRTIDNNKQWFPFDKHKESHWSLEHIHAQQSNSLTTNVQRVLWMTDHLKALDSLKDCKPEEESTKIEELCNKMKSLIIDIEKNSNTASSKERFDKIHEEALQIFSQGYSAEFIHHISNMALLDCGQNAALSNYLFAAKRDIVVEWDKQGHYIPFCTKMVFFKYYTPSNENQLFYWGVNDRNAYVKAINEKIGCYYGNEMEPITI